MIPLNFYIWWLLLAGYLTSSIVASNIIVLMPVCSKSHKIAADPLMEELAKRGHLITEVTLFKTTKPHPNIKSIELHSMKGFFDIIAKESTNMTTPFSNFKRLSGMRKHMFDGTQILLNDETFKKFISNPGHADVIITSTIMNDIALTLIPIVFPNIPFVLLSTSTLAPNVAWSLNIPFPLSYIPVVMTPFSSKMTFLQRVVNSLVGQGFDLLLDYVMTSPMLEGLQPFYPDLTLPDPRNVEKNASLVLINSHFTLGGSKPTLPCAVEVGGMHCRDAEKLPTDFIKFIEGAEEHGFIVFSLGSVVQAEYLPRQIVDSFKAAFKKIMPVRVIWKYEGQLEGLSPNVMLSKWIPQQDLIGHPKCRLAITHGGLLSLQEANYHGVPVLGIPLGADRDGNLRLAADKGLAKTLDYDTLTSEIALEAIKSIIHNPMFKETAEQFGQLVRDRPQSPVETATYWVEYVIRHKGATHLKPNLDHLNIFQYFIIDVIAFLIAIVTAVILLIYFLLRTCFRCICRKKSKLPKNRKKTKSSKNRKID
ncbi:hypothetical protein CHUAL_013258 [Chamberlinius hualienensis]